jgi:hypothetical protein
MFTRSMIALAMVLGAASASLATTKPGAAPLQNVYNPRGAYSGPDPDLNVPFEVWPDYECGPNSWPVRGQPPTGRF